MSKRNYLASLLCVFLFGLSFQFLHVSAGSSCFLYGCLAFFVSVPLNLVHSLLVWPDQCSFSLSSRQRFGLELNTSTLFLLCMQGKACAMGKRVRACGSARVGACVGACMHAQMCYGKCICVCIRACVCACNQSMNDKRTMGLDRAV